MKIENNGKTLESVDSDNEDDIFIQEETIS